MTNQIPPSAMPLISPTALLSAHLAQSPPTRPSNRSPTQPRAIELNTSSLTHCSGSSLVKIGATSIVCGVRAEILPVSDIPSFRISKTTSPSESRITGEGGIEGDEEEEDEAELSLYNLLVPNLELSTGCSPLHPAHTAPSVEAQSLSQRLLSLLLSSRVVRLEDLEIWHVPEPATSTATGIEGDSEPQLKAYWTLYIDMLCISHAGTGSVFDATWLALYAALRDTLLPKPIWDVDDMAVYCDPDINEARHLRLRGMPVPLSFGCFEDKLLVDLDSMEEECCVEKGCVVVDRGGEVILRIERWGGGSGVKIIELLRLAGERWREWKKVLGEKS